jgi:hypothetical protein
VEEVDVERLAVKFGPMNVCAETSAAPRAAATEAAVIRDVRVVQRRMS